MATLLMVVLNPGGIWKIYNSWPISQHIWNGAI